MQLHTSRLGVKWAQNGAYDYLYMQSHGNELVTKTVNTGQFSILSQFILATTLTKLREIQSNTWLFHGHQSQALPAAAAWTARAACTASMACSCMAWSVHGLKLEGSGWRYIYISCSLAAWNTYKIALRVHTSPQSAH